MELKEAKEVLNKNGYCLIDESGVGDLTDIIRSVGKLEDEFLDKRDAVISEKEKIEDKQEDILKELVYKTLNPFFEDRNIDFYYGYTYVNDRHKYYFGLKDKTSKLYQQSKCYVIFDEDTEKFYINPYYKDKNIIDVRHPETGNFVKLKFTKNKKFKSTPAELQKIYFNVADALYGSLEIKIPVKENDEYNKCNEEIDKLRDKIREIDSEYANKGITLSSIYR